MTDATAFFRQTSDTLQRGLNVTLDADKHTFVHDAAQPLPARAHMLLSELKKKTPAIDNEELQGSAGGLGEFWTRSPNVARDAADYQNEGRSPGQRSTHVVLHAQPPAAEHYWSEMASGPDHPGNYRVPLRPGSPVGVLAVSWGEPGGEQHHYDFTEPVDKHASLTNFFAQAADKTRYDSTTSEEGRHGAADRRPERGAGDPEPSGDAHEPTAHQHQPAEGRRRQAASAGDGEAPDAVERHPDLQGDLDSLGGGARHVQDTIDALHKGDSGVATYPLSHPLEGWHAAITSGGHQVIHRHDPDTGHLHVGYAGHNTAEAEQRLGGGSDGGGAALPVEFHGGAEKDFDKLPGHIQDKTLDTIDRLSRQERHHTDHGWTGKLKDWRSARADYLYRITHRYEDEHGNTVAPGHASAARLYIGHIGPHDYLEAERRLASTATAFFRQAAHQPDEMMPMEHLLGVRSEYGNDGQGRPILMGHVAQWSADAMANDRYEPEHLHAFVHDVRKNGIEHPVHLWPDADGHPRMVDGTHRAWAAAQAGLSHVPVRWSKDYLHDELGLKDGEGWRPSQATAFFRQTASVDEDDYRLQHQAPGPGEGNNNLAELGHGSHVQIYRAVPHGIHDIHPGDWVSTSSDYAHQHGYHANDSRRDWPVLTARVPAEHVWTDHNDENEQGYHGPPLKKADFHHPDLGEVSHLDAQVFQEEHEEQGIHLLEPFRGDKQYTGAAVHLSPEDHAFVHDKTKPLAERAQRLHDNVPVTAHAFNDDHADADDASLDADMDAETLHERGAHPHPPTHVVLHGHDGENEHSGISWAAGVHDPENEYAPSYPHEYEHHTFGQHTAARAPYTEDTSDDSPVTFDYHRRTTPAPQVPSTFHYHGQDIEPHGRYVMQGKAHVDLPDLESGTLTFQRPLRLHSPTDQVSDPNHWKQQLVRRYDGKTGRELSQAIRDDGYDGIMTHDEHGPSETVDLTDLHPRNATAFFRQASEGESGPFFHGTAHEFQPGDLVDPSYELGGRRGKSYAFMTSDADVAHNYGKYKAQARNAIGEDAVGRAYEVRPTGPVEADDTVDDRFKAFRTRHPMQVVREVHPSKEATASAGTFQEMLHAEAAGPAFTFQHTETDTGGSGKYQHRVDLTAHHPETGEQVGKLRYYPPKRKNAPVSVDEFEGSHPGAASALMNEMESRHPGSRVVHLVDKPMSKGKPTYDHPMYGQPSDWKARHPELPEQVHRGLSLRLEGTDARNVSQGQGSVAEHAEILRDALHGSGPAGMHWSSDEKTSRTFSQRNIRDPRTDVPVVLHADRPEVKDIETRPSVLKNNGVWSHDYEHGDAEVPIRRGRGVHIRGISWKPDAEHPDADEGGWLHHTFDEPRQHTAAAVPSTATFQQDLQAQAATVESSRSEDVPQPEWLQGVALPEGPYFHGTRAELEPGEHLHPGYRPANFSGFKGRRLKNIYFSADHDEARSYGDDSREAGETKVYEVEPTGDFEHDPMQGPWRKGRDLRSQHPLRVVRKVTGVAGHTVEAAVESFDDGVMVALVPPREVAEQIAQEGGQPVEDLHVTMAYLGNVADYGKEQLAWLPELVGSWAARQKPVDVRIGGTGKFTNSADDQHVLWAAVDIPGGAQMHSSLAAFLEGHGYKLPSEHGWTPHLTLAYVGEHFRFLPKLPEHSWRAGEVWTFVGKERSRGVLGPGPR